MLSDEIKQYLVKVCQILNTRSVDYLVIGGAAVSHYGFNRPSGVGQLHGLTVDLDFWYSPTLSNFENLIRALDDLKVDTSDLRKLVFDKERTFLKIPHKDFHTDFLPVVKGLNSFRESRAKAETIDVDRVSISIISFEDLIANKLAVGRKIDQSDIAELSNARKKKRGKGI